MPRLPRLDEPGSIHHVMNRGARHEPIFGNDACYVAFLTLLSSLPGRYGVKIHGYALMPNHFHLMVTAGTGGLGPAMARLQSGYSRWLNRTFEWDGPVWKSRFRSRRIEVEEYLQHVLAYMHLNPVEANIAKNCDEAAWTSHRSYTGASRAPDWLETERLTSSFGTLDAYRSYVGDVRMGREPGPQGFAPEELWLPSKRTLPAPAKPTEQMSVEEAWAHLEIQTGESRGELMARGTGRPRWQWFLAIWWLPRATGMTNLSLARQLCVSRYSFSRAERRIHEMANGDAGCRQALESLKRELGV